MALTGDVKDVLAAIVSGKTTVRAAELATILRFSGGLHVISGRIAVESEVESEQLAKRIRRDIAELYGVRAEISIVPASGVRRTSQYLVRVLDGGDPSDPVIELAARVQATLAEWVRAITP